MVAQEWRDEGGCSVTTIMPRVPNWHFEVEEVSAGVYQVAGNASIGESFDIRGVDLDVLIEEARITAE